MAMAKPKTKSLKSAFDLKCALLDSAWLRLRKKNMHCVQFSIMLSTMLPTVPDQIKQGIQTKEQSICLQIYIVDLKFMLAEHGTTLDTAFNIKFCLSSP